MYFKKHQVGQTNNAYDSLACDLGCQGSLAHPNVFNIYYWRKFGRVIHSF